jgi:hypothetical protein
LSFCLNQTWHRNAIIQYVAFCVWLLHLAWIIMFSRCSPHSSLWLNNTSLNRYTRLCLSIYQWCTFGSFPFWQFWRMTFLYWSSKGHDCWNALLHRTSFCPLVSCFCFICHIICWGTRAKTDKIFLCVIYLLLMFFIFIKEPASE